MLSWVLRVASICFLIFFGSLIIRIWWTSNLDPKQLAAVLMNMLVAYWVLIFAYLLVDRMRGRKYLLLMGLFVSGLVVEAACRIVF